ncbi:hypothetical protein HPB50_002342 [Hyalomma asiaticum]|uniref:Uncharacterized protein n=1 Tax=Hyalomma asiaticum TaxID=266040 RepID=A0ACB7TFR1_HYAAI|nr:hypothetical protein HPB50_002342 [Hyalomma asiaticum]
MSSNGRYENYTYEGPPLYAASQQADYALLQSIGQPLAVEVRKRKADEQQSSDCSCGSSPECWARGRQPKATRENGEPSADVCDSDKSMRHI